MLKVKDLHVCIEGEPVLKGLNLEVKAGEVHAIMGPNGSGKSTLAKVMAGHPAYEVTKGSIEYEIDGEFKDILEMSPDERSLAGLFLAFQYPVEVPGVSNLQFLKTAFNNVCKAQGAEELSDEQFLELAKQKAKDINFDMRFLDRSLNEGFSGGEKKRNEIFQMAMLSPRLAFLDETDSGLDIDALKVVSQGINSFQSQDNAVVLVTHYQRILNYVQPDFIHILVNGQIIKTGDKSLALELEKQGYESFA